MCQTFIRVSSCVSSTCTTYQMTPECSHTHTLSCSAKHTWVEHASQFLHWLSCMFIMNKRVCKDGMFSIHFIIKHPAVCNFMQWFFYAVFWDFLVKEDICHNFHSTSYYFNSCEKYKDFDAEWASVFHMHRKLIYSDFIQIRSGLSTLGYYKSSTVMQ